jgi:hypothetical protein
MNRVLECIRPPQIAALLCKNQIGGRVIAAVIPFPGSIGNVFVIDRSQWVAVNDRVALVIEAQPVGAEIGRIVTNYAALLNVCTQWKNSTFASLIAQAVLVNLFAQKAVDTLTKVRDGLAGLDPNDPAPFILKVGYAAMADTAGQLHGTTFALATAIAAFVSENHTTDAILEQIGQRLGPAWQSIAGPIGQLESAIADVQGDWSQVDGILATVSNKTSTVTVADLLAADIGGAIVQWQEVQTVTLAFDSMATNLT